MLILRISKSSFFDKTSFTFLLLSSIVALEIILVVDIFKSRITGSEKQVNFLSIHFII